MNLRRWIGGILIIMVVIGIGIGITIWKYSSIQEANAIAAGQPEPMESVTVAIAEERMHHPVATSIGTVTALRSITLLNEVPGTVQQVNLIPGQVVDTGTVLLMLDVSVEEAELRQLEAQATLAKASLARIQSISNTRAVSAIDVDRARSELDVAQAQVARTKAVIARKILRAPFRARVGISDIHPGQYLNEGTQITTLQGVDNTVYVDFAVAQQIAAGLRQGDSIEIFGSSGSPPIMAKVVAVDAKIDPTTRNATVRAKIDVTATTPAPGSSVRVQVPAGEPQSAIAIPVSALRKGPGGDHVFVIVRDKEGKTRTQMRQVQSSTVLGDEVLIVKGLSAGEQLAASGSFKLRDNSLVVITTNQNKN